MLFILQDKIAYLRVDGIAGTATVSQEIMHSRYTVCTTWY